VLHMRTLKSISNYSSNPSHWPLAHPTKNDFLFHSGTAETVKRNRFRATPRILSSKMPAMLASEAL